MNTAAFSSIPPMGRFALVDLVETKNPEVNSTKPDNATRLLVVSDYPTTQACLIALAKRKEWGPELFTEAIRTYAARPWSPGQAAVVRTIMKALGLVRRIDVPRLDGVDSAEILGRLVRASAIHDELPAIGIAVYPSPEAMLTMLGDPDYKSAHVHRAAELARTRLLATQPLAGV